jgi:O-antigen/teichoic acid export membrane protein
MEMPEGVVDPPPAGVHGRVIRKNLSVVSLAYVIGSLSGFFALAYLARKLGNSTFGTFVAATALVNIVGVIDNLGGGNYLVRESSRDPTRMQSLMGDVLVLKAGANVVVIGLSIAAAAALGFGSTGLIVVAIMALMFGANAVSKTLRAGLQALERMEIASAISIGNAVLSAAGMAAVIAAGGGLVGAVAISTAVSIATIPVSWALLRRRVRFRLQSTWPTLRSVIRASFPFAVAGVLAFATTYADALVIRGVLGERQTGLYGAAYRIALVLEFIPSIYLDSVYRTMAHLSKVGVRALGEFVDRSCAWLCLAALPLAAGGTVIGGRVLTLVFGRSYAPATSAFQILLWSLVLGFPSWILMPAVTVDRPRTSAKIVGAAFVLNLGLNLLLVPRYGIIAAAWLTLAATAFISIVPTIVLARKGMTVRWPLLALPGLAVAGLMALAIYPLRNAPLFVPLAVGAVVYVAGLLLTRTPARLGLHWSAVRRVLKRRSDRSADTT